MFSAKQEKRKRQREIFKKLLDASNKYKEKDNFWAGVLLNCSKNKFPKNGFNFYNGVLSYGTGSSKKEIALTGSSDKIATLCIEFFRKFGAIYSPRELKKLKGLKKEPNKEKYNNWSLVKILTERKILLEDYIEKKYHDRPSHVKDRIFNLLSVGIDSKHIKKDMIDYENGTIFGISGINEERHNVFNLS